MRAKARFIFNLFVILSMTLALLPAPALAAMPKAPEALVTVFTENFDSVTAPALPTGWAMIQTAGTNTTTSWKTATNTVHPSTGGVHSAPNLVYFNSYSVSTGNNARLYRTTGIDLKPVCVG